MKKVTSLAILFFSFVAIAHAQLQKTSTPPAYDNVNTAHLIKHVLTPCVSDKFLAMDNEQVSATDKAIMWHNINTHDNRTYLSAKRKMDADLFKIQSSDGYHSPNSYEIKKVTFPITNYYITN